MTRSFDRGSAFVEYRYIGKNYVDTLETVLFDARNTFNIGLNYNLSPTARLTIGVDDVFNDANNWRMRPAGGITGAGSMLPHPVEGRTFYMSLNMVF